MGHRFYLLSVVGVCVLILTVGAINVLAAPGPASPPSASDQTAQAMQIPSGIPPSIAGYDIIEVVTPAMNPCLTHPYAVVQSHSPDIQGMDYAALDQVVQQLPPGWDLHIIGPGVSIQALLQDEQNMLRGVQQNGCVKGGPGPSWPSLP